MSCDVHVSAYTPVWLSPLLWSLADYRSRDSDLIRSQCVMYGYSTQYTDSIFHFALLRVTKK